jgi:hypothetical protein
MTATANNTCDTQSVVLRDDFVSFRRLLTGTRMVADRCREYLAGYGPARETFGYLIERFASIRARFHDLSPNEQDIAWIEVQALAEDVLALRRLLARHERARYQVPLIELEPPVLGPHDHPNPPHRAPPAPCAGASLV